MPAMPSSRPWPRCCAHAVRACDLVIRYGGEEFLIILLDSTGEAGEMVAEKIRQAVADLKVAVAGGILQKTISIGVADFTRGQ